MKLPELVSRTLAYRGRLITVRSDELRMPDGRTVGYDVVEHPGSVAIVASPRPGEVVLIRQYRHAIDRLLWEIPAGKLEAGESDVLESARRELAEETGYRATSVREIAAFYPTAGFCNERLHLVVAEGLTTGEQSLDEDETIDVHVVTVDEALVWCARGEIEDAKTLLALLWLAHPVDLKPNL